ncbi:MAG: hypothetical protein JEZ07_01625 [Phycisphaerae bacterium]|nr:hypothetical protein [Phycisphaerae bacterium]
MSRSHRKPILTITNKIDKDKAHKAVRNTIKSRLSQIQNADDLVEIDQLIFNDDIRAMQKEEWGTKLGWQWINIKDGNEDEGNIECAKKHSRK